MLVVDADRRRAATPCWSASAVRRRAPISCRSQHGLRREDTHAAPTTARSAGIDFGVLADLDMDKQIDLDSLISRTYKFDEINEGFRLMMAGDVARGVIVF